MAIMEHPGQLVAPTRPPSPVPPEDWTAAEAERAAVPTTPTMAPMRVRLQETMTAPSRVAATSQIHPPRWSFPGQNPSGKTKNSNNFQNLKGKSRDPNWSSSNSVRNGTWFFVKQFLVSHFIIALPLLSFISPPFSRSSLRIYYTPLFFWLSILSNFIHSFLRLKLSRHTPSLFAPNYPASSFTTSFFRSSLNLFSFSVSLIYYSFFFLTHLLLFPLSPQPFPTFSFLILFSFFFLSGKQSIIILPFSMLLLIPFHVRIYHLHSLPFVHF